MSAIPPGRRQAGCERWIQRADKAQVSAEKVDDRHDRPPKGVFLQRAGCSGDFPPVGNRRMPGEVNAMRPGVRKNGFFETQHVINCVFIPFFLPFVLDERLGRA